MSRRSGFDFVFLRCNCIVKSYFNADAEVFTCCCTYFDSIGAKSVSNIMYDNLTK